MTCNEERVEGCFCKDGWVRDSFGQCIRLAECDYIVDQSDCLSLVSNWIRPDGYIEADYEVFYSHYPPMCTQEGNFSSDIHGCNYDSALGLQKVLY